MASSSMYDIYRQLGAQGTELPYEVEHQDDGHISDDSAASDQADQSPETTNHANKKPRNYSACLSCRRQKTRCEFANDDGPCKLCLKYNRECVKAPPKRRRMKTVTRIADLEQKIQTLTDALEIHPPTQIPRDTAPREERKSTSNWKVPIDTTQAQKRPLKTEPEVDTVRYDDIIDRGLIQAPIAYAGFERWRCHLAQHFYTVNIPQDISADAFRRSKPLLFSALALAGISTIRPDLTSNIAEDISRSLAKRIVHHAERSLELVQTLLVYVCYYSRSLQKKDLTFYQFIHMACTMALEIGLGRRSNKFGPYRDQIPESESLEGRRVWLACYHMAVNAAICLRHPTFVRWSTYIEECLEVLDVSPPALPTDLLLCDAIRLTRIMEDTATAFAMDDPGYIVSLRDPKTKYQLGALERQLERWRREAKHDLNDPISRVHYAVTKLYIHEIALHQEHDIDRFRSPPVFDEVTQTLEELDIAPARVDALYICLESIHELMDAMFEIEMETLRMFPNLFFVRVGYAAVILNTLSSIFESSAWGNSSTPTIDVKFDYYIKKATKVLVEVGKEDQKTIASNFSHIMKRVKAMHDRRKKYLEQSRAINNTGTEQPVIAGDVNIPTDAAPTTTSYPAMSFPSQDISYNYPQQQPLPTSFNFNDFDTNMFDINAFNIIDPNFNLYNLGNPYPTDSSSMSADT